MIEHRAFSFDIHSCTSSYSNDWC